ncbi:LacI family DNA-binding transcriptional regulator [Paracoccus sp. IB05]|uniref:LacI family DNA-binding transcriptional regulator n=1 Tax=Paracoccus sp. IB05 TaxID=2779367 RepID=UPI0018E71F3B|nr:LacI family DNA-binding transcriptional regulator [Paracoccus sp. IB05]MBJ2150035.1 LacI family DNA-binding transcriptional regulator [Paracoccus sp. IB05]
MMRKPTLREIATLAGVGTATVERVLNGRAAVRPGTAEKVIAAARALNTPRLMPVQHHGIFRIEVLLLKPESAFFRRLSQAFERIAATLDATVQIHRSFVDPIRPEDLARWILRPAARRSGLILALSDQAPVRDALRDLAATGLPMFDIVTRAGDDMVPLVGIDNLAAGRSAGHFIARMQPRPGPVIAIGDPICRVHRDRLRGISDCFRDNPRPGMELTWFGFGSDLPPRLHDRLAVLREHPGQWHVGSASRAGLVKGRYRSRPARYSAAHRRAWGQPRSEQDLLGAGRKPFPPVGCEYDHGGHRLLRQGKHL